MKSLTIPSADRVLCEIVADLIFCNPFDPRRFQLYDALLGETYREELHGKMITRVRQKVQSLKRRGKDNYMHDVSMLAEYRLFNR